MKCTVAFVKILNVRPGLAGRTIVCPHLKFRMQTSLDPESRASVTRILIKGGVRRARSVDVRAVSGGDMKEGL